MGTPSVFPRNPFPIPLEAGYPDHIVLERVVERMERTPATRNESEMEQCLLSFPLRTIPSRI